LDRKIQNYSFFIDHPGGKRSILLYAGKDASEEVSIFFSLNIGIKKIKNSNTFFFFV
jgi:hypothetical protein